MKINEFDLENHWFYRLIKVAHVFFLVIAGLIGLLIIVISINDEVTLWGILWSALWVCFSYVILNIFKEALLYIAFGKKISWKWLADIKILLKKR